MLGRSRVTIAGVEFAYELVGIGWAAARITHGDQTAQITASYLSDALGDLLLAVWTLTEGETDARCTWDEEPGEYRWLFHRGGDSVYLHVQEFGELWGGRPDEQGRTVFQGDVPLRSLVVAVAAAAVGVEKQYGHEGYRKKWVEHDFPADTLTQLQRWLQWPTTPTGGWGGSRSVHSVRRNRQ